MYLPVCICETKTRILIDTGAEITIMSQKLFAKIPKEIKPKIVNTECKMKLEVAEKCIVHF